MNSEVWDNEPSLFQSLFSLLMNATNHKLFQGEAQFNAFVAWKSSAIRLSLSYFEWNLSSTQQFNYEAKQTIVNGTPTQKRRREETKIGKVEVCDLLRSKFPSRPHWGFSRSFKVRSCINRGDKWNAISLKDIAFHWMKREMEDMR